MGNGGAVTAPSGAAVATAAGADVATGPAANGKLEIKMVSGKGTSAAAAALGGRLTPGGFAAIPLSPFGTLTLERCQEVNDGLLDE